MPLTNVTQQPHFYLPGTKIDMCLRHAAPIDRLTDRTVTLIGAAPSFDAAGRNFNGSDEYVTIADAADLRPGTGPFQLHVWTKIGAQIKIKGFIFSKGGTAATHWALYIDSDTSAGKIVFVGDNGRIVLISTLNTYENDGITHLVSVIRVGTVANLYVDKAPAASDSPAGGELDSAADINIGTKVSSATQIFTGKIIRVQFATATRTFAQAEGDMAVIYRRGAFTH